MNPVEVDGNAFIPALVSNGTERRRAEEDVLAHALEPRCAG